MRQLFFTIIIIVLFNGIYSCSYAQKEPDLKEKIGQMIMLGFSDTLVSDESSIVKDIQNYNIGGVIIYEYDAVKKARPRNITSIHQLKKLTIQLQSYSKTPLFIGIDEEGGSVSRLKERYGFKPTKSAQNLGEIDNVDSTRFYAERIANSCKMVGVNLNFAPVVDVNVNPDCPVIGGIKRSFSSDAEKVVKHSSIYIEAHLKNQVWTSLKHFPGHGSATSDSHLGFTDVSDSWTRMELKPYEILIQNNLCPMIMTAHVFNKNLDSKYPATLSKRTLSILRDTLDYKGLILSDDMMMRAIADHFGLEESIEKAINAGVDMLLFSNNIDVYEKNLSEKLVNTIIKLVNTGKISEERINESYDRIMTYKRKAW
ncbi:MAG: glycoside hydrolase family 3 protein [Salinivirgaceae bacterium]|nr:glycoside hydrolase family 3 protein [Salinivirgaceae bacterium]